MKTRLLKTILLLCGAVALPLVGTAGNDLQLTAELSHPNCFGSNDGGIDLVVEGGVAPYTYSWSNGEKEEDISALYGGTYKVKVTDAVGNIAQASFELKRPAPLQVNINKVSASSVTAEDGKIDLALSGGTAPYRIDIKNELGLSVEQCNLPGGIYKVEVEDGQRCKLSFDVSVQPVIAKDPMEYASKTPR